MAGEPIGLVGVFDLANFDSGMASYLKQISKANDDTEKTASTFKTSFKDMGASVNSVAGTIGKVLVGATAGAAVALGGFAVKGIGQAEEMEKQMSAIASIMGKTTKEVKPLADQIVKLGLDPTLMVDATQAADAIQQLAKNGLSMDQILQGAAKSTVLLANATGAGFGEAANIATGAMKLFNIDAKDMQGAVSGMVSVTTNSKLTIGDYAQALANGGGAATAAGVSFKDFNTTLAATAPLFAGGGDAATSLKTFLNRLQPTTKAATDEMIKLGFATKDGASKFFDAKGQIKSMDEISGILAKGLTGLSDAQKSQALSTIFGADAMRTAVGLANTGQKGFEALQQQMSKTDAADAAAVRMDNLAGVIEIAKGAIDSISLSIGQAFLPMLTDAAKGMSQFVSDHGQQLIDFFQTIADVIAAFVSGTPTDFPWEDIFPPTIADVAYGIAQTIEGIGQVVADMRSGVFGPDYPWEKIFPPYVATVAKIMADAIQFVSDHLVAFEGALAGIAVVLGSAAIYSALAALGAAIAAISLPMLAIIGVAALLGAAWASDWGGIQEIVLPIIEGIGVAITDVGIVIKSFSEDVPGAYPWEDIFPPWLADTMHYIGETVQGVQTVMDDFHNGVFGADYPWAEVFPPGIAQLADTTQTAIVKVNEALTAMQAAFAPLTDAITKNGAGALTEIQTFATGGQTSFENLTAVWNGLTATATNVFNGIAPIISAAYTAIVAAFAPWGTAALDWIATAIANAPSKLMEWYTALTGAVSANLANWLVYLGAWADPLVNWVDTSISNLGGKISSWYTALTQTITGYLSQWIPYLTAWSDPLVNWIETAVSNLPAKISGWYTGLTGAVTGYLGGWVLYFTAWADPMITWIDTAIANIGVKVGAWFTALQSSVAEQLPGWVAAFPGWVDAAVNWLGTAALQVAGKIGEYMNTLLPTLAANLPDWIAAFFDWAAAATDWVTTASAAIPAALGLFVASIITWATGEGLNKVVTGFVGWGTKFLGWVDTDLIPKVAPAMGRFLAELLVGLGKIAAGVVVGAALVANAILNTIKNTDWVKLGTDILDLFVKGYKVEVDAITALAKSTAEAIAQKFKDVDWNALGALILTYLKNGFDSMVTTITGSISDLAGKVKTEFLAIDWARIGTDILLFVGNGIGAGLTDLLAVVTNITTSLTTQWNGIDWTALGTNVLTNIGAGASASDTVAALYKKFTDLISGIVKKFTDYDWTTMGKAIMDGLLKGINDNVQKIWDKLTSITDTIKQKIKDALGIGSPAKELIPHGKAIVDGLIVGIESRRGALLASIQNVVDTIQGIITHTSVTRDWFPTFTSDIPGLKGARSYSDALDEILSLTKDIMGQNPELSASFQDAFDQNDKINASMKSRIDLLEIMRKYNLDPASVLGGQDINSADPKTILQSLQGAANQIAKMTNAQLYAEQFELKRLALITQLTAKFGDQLGAISQLGNKPMNFFSAVMFQQAKTKFDTLTDQINQASQTAMAYGATQANQSMLNLAAQREAVLQSIKTFQDNYNTDTTTQDLETSVLQKQLTMLDQAKKLGWDLSNIYTGFFRGTDTLSTESLRSMAFLQNALSSAGVTELKKQVAEKALLDTLDTSWNISGIASSFANAYSDQVMAPLLANLKDVVLLEDERAQAMTKYNNALRVGQTIDNKSKQLGFLNDQIALLKQVADAGLDIKTIFAGALNGSNLLGSGANINSLLAISNQLMDSLVKKAQDQLTPQAVALVAQQQQVSKQKEQLDLLNRQLDIIHQGQQAGVNWEGFFAGLTTGVNASESDILTATARLYDKLIKQALTELGIHSPSKVMMDIGEKASAGLGIGFAKGFNFIGSMLSTIPTAPVSNNRSLNFSMGGVNIYNGMDEMMLESKIMGIMERRF